MNNNCTKVKYKTKDNIIKYTCIREYFKDIKDNNVKEIYNNYE